MINFLDILCHTWLNLFNLNCMSREMLIGDKLHYYCECGYKKPVMIKVKKDSK